MSEGDRRDFFVSYRGPDQAWAEWIGATLEDEGFSVILAPWDFRRGANIVEEMDDASARAAATLAVVSHAYVEGTRYSSAEWTAAFRKDSLFPTRIDDVELPGTLGNLGYVDLFGLSAEQASERLISEARSFFSGERRKPAHPPPFPGDAHTPVAGFPGAARPVSDVVRPDVVAVTADGHVTFSPEDALHVSRVFTRDETVTFMESAIVPGLAVARVSESLIGVLTLTTKRLVFLASSLQHGGAGYYADVSISHDDVAAVATRRWYLADSPLGALDIQLASSKTRTFALFREWMAPKYAAYIEYRAGL